MPKILWPCIFSLALSACASVYTQTNDAYADAGIDCSDHSTIPNIYSGFVFDLYCLPAENFGFFCLVDLPFSLFVDTVMVPYTAYKQIKYGSWYTQEACKALQKTDSADARLGGENFSVHYDAELLM